MFGIRWENTALGRVPGPKSPQRETTAECPISQSARILTLGKAYRYTLFDHNQLPNGSMRIIPFI